MYGMLASGLIDIVIEDTLKAHDYMALVNVIEGAGGKITDKYGQTNFANLIWKSDNSISVEKESAEKLFKLLNTLEENEDVQLVSSNFNVSDEILTSLTVQ